MDDRPPLSDSIKIEAINQSIKQVRDGFNSIAQELAAHPVICVIRWVQKSQRISNGYVYEIYDLGDGDVMPAHTGADVSLEHILNVAEDYKALVVFFNQRLTRHLQLSNIPAVLLSEDERKELTK